MHARAALSRPSATAARPARACPRVAGAAALPVRRCVWCFHWWFCVCVCHGKENGWPASLSASHARAPTQTHYPRSVRAAASGEQGEADKPAKSGDGTFYNDERSVRC